MRIKEVIGKIFFFLCLLIVIVVQADRLHAETQPKDNHGRKWRIGYYEGGPYRDYTTVFRQIIMGLAELGWLEPLVIPNFDDPEDSKQLWDFLAKHVKSDYLEFVPDAYWSTSWNKEKREVMKKTIIARLSKEKDLDFMFAAGTWAGLDLANNNHSTTTMAFSVSDPVKAGMVASAQYSGSDHFHVKCDPDRYIRQIRLFHRLVKFKKLGFVYENTVEGRSYAAIDDIYRAAKDRNFTVVSYPILTHSLDLKETTDRLINCYEKLAREVDAVYVTEHRFDFKRMKELVAPFLKKKIPTWSQRGPDEVKKGLLFSMTKAKFDAMGKFHAQVMARAFNGETIGKINQIFTEPEFIAVNVKVAEIIGFKIPRSILRISDEVYDSIDYD